MIAEDRADPNSLIFPTDNIVPAQRHRVYVTGANNRMKRSL